MNILQHDYLELIKYIGNKIDKISDVMRIYKIFKISNIEVVKYLIDNKIANLNEVDNKGNTLLHCLCAYDIFNGYVLIKNNELKYEHQYTIIKYLIDRGCNFMLKDNNGKIPYEYTNIHYMKPPEEIIKKTKKITELSTENVEDFLIRYPKYISKTPPNLLTFDLCMYLFKLNYDDIKYIPFRFHERIFEELEEMEI